MRKQTKARHVDALKQPNFPENVREKIVWQKQVANQKALTLNTFPKNVQLNIKESKNANGLSTCN